MLAYAKQGVLYLDTQTRLPGVLQLVPSYSTAVDTDLVGREATGSPWAKALPSLHPFLSFLPPADGLITTNQ